MRDSIIIDRPPQAVFQTLVDPAQVSMLSQNIGNVSLETTGAFEKDSRYRRVLYSHGLPISQVVTFEEYEQDRLLTTRTILVGFEVRYQYILESTSDGKTLLTLEKYVWGGWPIFKLLVIHLLTRPEHDGDHLQRIKYVSEGSQPR